jgi:hypothetical protein
LVTDTDGVDGTLDSGTALEVDALEVDALEILGVGLGVGDSAAACFPECRVSTSTSPRTTTTAPSRMYHVRRCQPGPAGGFGGGSASSHSTPSESKAMPHHSSAPDKRSTVRAASAWSAGRGFKIAAGQQTRRFHTSTLPEGTGWQTAAGGGFRLRAG